MVKGFIGFVVFNSSVYELVVGRSLALEHNDLARRSGDVDAFLVDGSESVKECALLDGAYELVAVDGDGDVCNVLGSVFTLDVLLDDDLDDGENESIVTKLFHGDPRKGLSLSNSV